MAVLVGVCKIHGGLEGDELEGPEKEGHANPCPACNEKDTCDVRWVNEPFSGPDMETIMQDPEIPSDANVFPGSSPGSFHPVLVVFVDHPMFTRFGFDERMRRRCKMHWTGDKTEQVILVSMTKFSMQSKLETRNFGPMVGQWRWFDETFSPYVTFRTKDREWDTHALYFA